MKTRIALLVVLFGCTQLYAEIYKCTDAQGETQYSDEPCGSNATVFVPSAAPVPGGDVAERRDKTERLLRAYELKNAEQQRLQTEERAARDESEKNCTRARNRLRNVTQARGLYRLDDDGSRVALSFEERAASEEKARVAVARWCD